ncbi:type I-U CRISPR-associated protein Cas5/Cas6 [bacterium]|nr:MAG: type I-U CRISPR-associated protein Cas5/Cas6 [bacterium]
MTTIAARFLSNRYVARRSDDLASAEWPPSPDRLYQALVNAASRLDVERGKARAWLEWLSGQPAPTIVAVPQVQERTRHRRYDPRNAETRRQVVEQGRKHVVTLIDQRQDLIDLVDTPLAHPLVIYHYADRVPDDLISVADRVAANVGYLGTSESPVLLRLAEPIVGTDHRTFVPDDDGDLILPTPYPNRLGDLDAMFADAYRPDRPVWAPSLRIDARRTRYAIVENRKSRPRSGDYEDLVALAFTVAPNVDSRFFPAFVAAVRAAYLRRLPDGVHGMLSGHDHTAPDPSSTAYPGAHAAFLPLADVNMPYASSRLRGIALALPYAMGYDPRRQAIAAFDIDHIVVAGSKYELTPVIPLDREFEATRLARYSRVGRTWATLTPIRLWKMPNRNGGDVPALVAEAIQQTGYPEPRWIEIGPAPYVPGALHVTAYRHRFEKPYWLVHARFQFSEPVRGPMLVGRGRSVGFGFCGLVNSAGMRVA